MRWALFQHKLNRTTPVCRLKRWCKDIELLGAGKREVLGPVGRRSRRFILALLSLRSFLGGKGALKWVLSKHSQCGVSGLGVILAIWVIPKAMFEPKRNAIWLSILEKWALGIQSHLHFLCSLAQANDWFKDDNNWQHLLFNSTTIDWAIKIYRMLH